jgi:hypothetical protein
MYLIFCKKSEKRSFTKHRRSESLGVIKTIRRKTMKLLKLFILSLCLFAFALSGVAQETPAGKKFAENFWKAIADGKENAAKNALDAVKRREPNFDATKMEKAFAEMTSKKEAEVTTAKDNLTSKIEAGKTIGKLFGGDFRITPSTKETEIKSFIEERSKMVDGILSMDRKLVQDDLDSAARRLNSSVSVDTRRVTELVTRINESVEQNGLELIFYDLLLHQSRWDNARKIYPGETAFSTLYNSISTSINSLGTADQRAAKALKNLNAKIDAERLSRSPVKDAKLEKWFKDMFIDASAMRSNGFSFLRVVVLDYDYNIRRNAITGIVIGRARGADIAFKDKNGKCKHGVYAISQEYVGGSFTNAALSQDFDIQEMRCENVNK